MTKDVFTMGAEQRAIVVEWYLNQALSNAYEAKILLIVQAALDEVTYDYKVAIGEEYTYLEYILFYAYNVAIGNCSFDDLLDNKAEGDLFTIQKSDKGFTLIKV